MKLEIARPEDSKACLEFYQNFILPGLVELKSERPQGFFAPYKSQTDDYETYLLREEENNSIQAMASFVYRKAFYQGERITTASATDLRVNNNRRALLEWSHHFLPVMEKVLSEKQISHIFSFINLADPTALSTFIRPRTMKRPMPRYFLYRKVNLVGVHGKFPWAQPPLPDLRIAEGNDSNIDALIAYIIRRSQFRPFASILHHDSFFEKIGFLKGMKISDFLVAFDGNNNVVGCMAPWSARGVSDYVPQSYSLRAHNFRQFLKFAWVFGMTRRLAKPVGFVGRHEVLNFRHLTNIFVDNEDIFESLLWEAFHRAHKNEFLLYAQAEKDFRINPPLSWISSTLPYALYAVVPPSMEKPEFLHPGISLNPEIESFHIL